MKECAKPLPEGIVVRSFVLAILLGTLLLLLPQSVRPGRSVSAVDAFFTATSATCVTGLATVDVGTTFSHAGQMIILLMIQIGGLGVMTFGTFFLVALGRRMSLKDEFVLMDSLGHETVRGLRGLLLMTVGYTLVFEAAGALMISWRLAAAHGFPWDRALYHGVFHSISAFCNAGLALYPDNLVSLRTDRVIVLTMAALIVLGGLGFIVLYNLSNIRFWNRNLLRRGRLNLHSRVVLLVSAGLILTGWLAFYLLEREGTLSLLPEADRITCSLFQSITPRTAGFNVVNMAEVHPATELLTVVLMFIGGSPASTAGGVKTTTLAVLAVTVLAITRSRERPALGHKTVPESIVREAITIFVLGLVVVVAVGFFLAISEKALLAAQPAFTSQDLVFETVSAFGTVGLSTGVTPYLSTAGKLSLSLCMFIGRLGPLTMAMIIGRRAVEPLIRYPEEPVVVG